MVDSVLMLTTLGSNCLAICENVLDICCGDGMVSGVASAALLPFFALHAVGNNRADQNADRECRQNAECVDPAMGPEAHPNCARIHMPAFLR